MRLGLLMVLVVILAVAACSTMGPHFGYTDEQWAAMTDKQRAKAQADFEQMVKSRDEAKRREEMDKELQRTADFHNRVGEH